MTVDSSASLQHVIGATGRFQLRQVSGSIEIRAVNGDTARVRERSGKSLHDVFRVETGEGRLTMTSPDRGGIDLVIFGIGRRSSLDLEVEVPRRADVSIETASADVDASGLAGNTRVRTASGDIELTNLSGNLELDAVSGEVDVRADGPLTVRCRTISGDCTLRAPQLGRAVVETTSGDVRLDALLAGSGPFEIQTVSGDVTIVGRTGIRVEARTVTGDLRSDLPHRLDTSPGRKQLIVGDGTTAVAFRSVSGDLRIVAPRDGSPSAAAAVQGSSPAVAMPTTPAPPSMPSAPMPPSASSQRVPPSLPDVALGDRDLGAAAFETAEPVTGHEAGHEVARLDILHALERGELSVDAAMRRLADIEEA
jgi:hypothetical protein